MFCHVSEILLALAASVLAPALAVQVPLGQTIPSVGDPTKWDLDKPPNPSDTDHLVFETVHSLLQHWPNTRMRNGHNIVPAVIPKGTLLYHGTNAMSRELPSGPEWVAMDPEHSYLFCNHINLPFLPQRHEGCWHLTLMATRPLKVVYFDGNSAAKMPYGSMDSQDLLAWGEAFPEDVWDELRLIKDLCHWGRNFSVDGFVRQAFTFSDILRIKHCYRMEMDFEVMLCDFTSGISVVSWTNLPCFSIAPPLEIWPPFAAFEVINSGSWHNRFPGETRFRLDLAGLVSFYDTQLVPSLISVRASQERWDHRVRDISSKDFSALKSRLEAALIRPVELSSGINWKTLIQTIVDRFAGRLELTRYLLNSPAVSSAELLDLARKTQTQLRIMLTPYLVLSATPSDPTDKAGAQWATPIYMGCATPHTSFIESELDLMTDSEKLLLRAVRGTSREICRMVTKMWVAGVYAGIDLSLNTKEFPDMAEVTRAWNIWAEDLDRLMEWLDWSVWVKCHPDCGPEEMCYLPTWPAGFPGPGGWPVLSDLAGKHPERLSSFDRRTMVREILAKEMRKVIWPEPDGWHRPQPRCITRVFPWDF